MGCGASMESLSQMAGGESGDADSTATKQLAPVNFKPLGLPSFDEVFDLSKDCFNTLTKCNRTMYGLVTGLLNATGKLNLMDAIKDAVIQARNAIDPYMPDNIHEIREQIKSAPADAAQSVAGVLADLKDLLPDIDTSDMTGGNMKLDMPKMALEKCPEAAKKMMQMVIDLAKAVVDCAAEGVFSMKPRIENAVEMVSGLSVSKLTDELKNAGMGMGEMMSKPTELQANLTEAAKLKEYGQVIVSQVTVIATGLGNGYKAAVEYIVEHSPELNMKDGSAQAEIGRIVHAES